MEDIIRIGSISSVDPINGTARVYYPDRDSTTAPLNLFAYRGEYSLPVVGDQVVVLHLPNDTSSGVILGRFWGGESLPPAGAEYQKNMTAEVYEAARGGNYTLHGNEIGFEGAAGSITLSELISLRSRVDALERRQ